MIRTLLHRGSTGELTAGDERLIDVWQREPDTTIWVDLAEEEAGSEKQLLADRFGLHPLAVQDAQRLRHQPKIETFDDHVFLLLKGLGPDTEEFEFETIQIAIFLGDRFLVTRHSGPSPSIERLWRSQLDDSSLMASGPDALTLRLARISVDRYVNRLLKLESRLEDLEEELVANPDDAILAELMGYKTNLRKFRRVLRYHVQVFSELTNRPPDQMRPDRVHEVRDVFEHQERASSLAGLYYEVASDLIEGYISLASHRLNNIMKVLTIVTAIFVPLSFLAGVYGMNFDYMPELARPEAYFVLLGVMVSIAAALLLVFKRKRWL